MEWGYIGKGIQGNLEGEYLGKGIQGYLEWGNIGKGILDIWNEYIWREKSMGNIKVVNTVHCSMLRIQSVDLETWTGQRVRQGPGAILSCVVGTALSDCG